MKIKTLKERIIHIKLIDRIDKNSSEMILSKLFIRYCLKTECKQLFKTTKSRITSYL